MRRIDIRLLASSGVLFMLPLGLIFAQASHALLAPYIGDFYILLHPICVLTALVVALVLLGKRFPAPPFVLYFATICMVIGLAISGYLGGSDFIYVARSIVLGIVPLVLMYQFLSPRQDEELYSIAVAAGLFVWGVAVIGLYGHYVFGMLHQYPHIKTLGVDEAILTLRSPGQQIGGEFPFFRIFGNMNKIANLALLATIASFAIYLQRGRGIAWFTVFSLSMTAILLFTFSRGAIVVAAVCALIAIAASLFQSPKSRLDYLLLAALLILPTCITVTSDTLRSYFVDTATLQTRIEQWESLTDDETSMGTGDLDLGILAFGYGPGRYGETKFGTPDARTHNMFLDIWTDGGLLAVVGFTALLIIPLVQGTYVLWKRWNHQVFAGILGLLAISALGLREYELAYLNTDSMGAVMLGWFISLAIAPKVWPKYAKGAAYFSQAQDKGRTT